MATKPRQRTAYSTNRLSLYYTVVFDSMDHFTLRLDLSAYYLQAPLKDCQWEESVEDILNRVNAYRSASFFKRWSLRWSTPIASDEAKLQMIRTAFYEQTRTGHQCQVGDTVVKERALSPPPT